MTSIFVDEQIAGGATLHRYRFTLAHEVAHWYLHEPLYKAARYTTVKDFVAFRDELPQKERANYEWQASQFAGLILVPPDALRATLARALERARNAGLESMDLSNEAQRDYVAEWIGRRLEVSASVVIRRGADDELWQR
jgi:Zn-dependent peptidase ImmA (M78 family)